MTAAGGTDINHKHTYLIEFKSTIFKIGDRTNFELMSGKYTMDKICTEGKCTVDKIYTEVTMI
jgi:hypothetical protein